MVTNPQHVLMEALHQEEEEEGLDEEDVPKLTGSAVMDPLLCMMETDPLHPALMGPNQDVLRTNATTTTTTLESSLSPSTSETTNSWTQKQFFHFNI